MDLAGAARTGERSHLEREISRQPRAKPALRRSEYQQHTEKRFFTWRPTHKACYQQYGRGYASVSRFYNIVGSQCPRGAGASPVPAVWLHRYGLLSSECGHVKL